MTQFRGKFTNKLDAKARVSVPAPFRARLAGEGLVLRRSTRHPCIEAWPASHFDAAARAISPLDEPTEEDDAIAYALLADVLDISPDPEGRMVLPRDLLDHASLSAAVTFMGRGEYFELWEPDAAEAQIAAARERMAARARAKAEGSGA